MRVVFKDHVVNKAAFSNHKNNESVNHNMEDTKLHMLNA